MTATDPARPFPATNADPAPPGAGPAAAQLWKAAHDFEAMAIGQLLEPMLSTVDTSEGMFGGGAVEQNFKPMMVTEMAREIEQRGGLGLAAPIYAQMLQMQEKHP